MSRTFAIITASKGRLEHLKITVPNMVAQSSAEVIVVDFSCPQGSGDYITRQFPSAQVINIEGEEYFSNWRARNAGAAAATSDILVFCDADTILADDAVDWLSKNLPSNTFGFFDRQASKRSNKMGPKLAHNQLRGFQVIPADAFRRAGGYDEVLQGYASGADTDLEDRLGLMGLVRFSLDPSIVASVIEHDIVSRTVHHADPIKTSYCAGLLYRAAKRRLLLLSRELELPIAIRRELYRVAREAASNLGHTDDKVAMDVLLSSGPVLMPRQLGYEKAKQSATLRIEIKLYEKLKDISG